MFILHIHLGYFHGHDAFLLHGETHSAIDEQKKIHIQLTSMWGWEKGSEVKSENLKYNSC